MTKIKMLDTGQIVDDWAPMGRLEGDVLYRGCWMLAGRDLFPPIKGGLKGGCLKVMLAAPVLQPPNPF